MMCMLGASRPVGRILLPFTWCSSALRWDQPESSTRVFIYPFFFHTTKTLSPHEYIYINIGV